MKTGCPLDAAVSNHALSPALPPNTQPQLLHVHVGTQQKGVPFHRCQRMTGKCRRAAKRMSLEKTKWAILHHRAHAEENSEATSMRQSMQQVVCRPEMQWKSPHVSVSIITEKNTVFANTCLQHKPACQETMKRQRTKCQKKEVPQQPEAPKAAARPYCVVWKLVSLSTPQSAAIPFHPRSAQTSNSSSCICTSQQNKTILHFLGTSKRQQRIAKPPSIGHLTTITELPCIVAHSLRKIRRQSTIRLPMQQVVCLAEPQWKQLHVKASRMKGGNRMLSNNCSQHTRACQRHVKPQ